MASQQAGQQIPHAEQPQQRNKDKFLQQVSDAVMQQALDNLANAQSAQNNTTITSQATNFVQQTGEQVKNMAQGAADAVKNTLGMNTDNTNTATPTDTGAGTRAGATATHPSSLTAEHPSNPTNNINISSSTINPRV